MSFLTKIQAEEDTVTLEDVVNEAAAAAIAVWKKHSGRQVSKQEEDRLASKIDDFFSDSKYAWFDRRNDE